VKGGARVEHNRQQLNSATYGGRPVGVDKKLLFVLPSVNASWNISERSVLRAGFGSTLNRPEFRELAPFAYYDFSANTVIYGNPALRTAAIQNTDARFEFYPSLTEVVSLGAFHKHFADPIEMY
jgi:outer membrane receptor protein involved in Fe transport